MNSSKLYRGIGVALMGALFVVGAFSFSSIVKAQDVPEDTLIIELVKPEDPVITVCSWKNDLKGYEEKEIKTSQLNTGGDHPDINPVPDAGCDSLNEPEETTISFCHVPPGNENNPNAHIDMPFESWEEAHDSGTGEHAGDFIIDSPEDLALCQPITDTDEDGGDDTGENTVTLHAQKIVCDNETDLPNWGGANTEVIDADTAADWVAQHESCDLVPWDFEWSYGDVGNPGDNLTTTGGAGWNAFDSGEAVVDVSEVPNNQIRVREIPQEGYIPFTGQNTDQDVSAEMYCTTDTVNYDNWEWISNPESGSDYYCVAWNVPTEPQVEGCTLDLFSDTQDWVEEAGAYAVPTWVHGSWTSIPGATWIWKTEEAENPRDGDTYTFKKMFNWTGGTVVAGDFDIAADNSYDVELNGNLVASDATIDNFSSADAYDLSGDVQNGLNTLEVTVKNWEWPTEDPHTNPAGLLYHFALEGTNELCGEVVDEEPEPGMCELTVVSDNTSTVVEDGDAPATEILPVGAWSAAIPGATWIWDQKDESDHGVGGPIRTFEKEFEWNGPVASAVLDIAADNSYKVWINGDQIPQAFTFVYSNWQEAYCDFVGDLVGQQCEEFNYAAPNGNFGQDQYDVASYIDEGTNVLKVEVYNWHAYAGALYKLEIMGEEGESCEPEPEVFQCNDGIDNDQDEYTDWPADPGCDSPTDDDESDDPEQCEAGAAWANEVVESDQGLLKNGGAVLAARSIEDSVLGEPDATTGPDFGFFSLGFGGSITVKFDQYVENVEGDDLSFHEITNDRSSYPEELAKVEVSQDGSNWKEIGTVSSKKLSGIDYLDFDSTGWTWIRYVRVTDVSDPNIHTATADGYDLDAIDATWAVCDEPDPRGSDVTICKYDEQETLLDGWTVWLDKVVGDAFAAVAVDVQHDYSGVTGEGQMTGCVVFEDVPYGAYNLGEDLKDGWEYVDGDAGDVVVDAENKVFSLTNEPKSGGDDDDGDDDNGDDDDDDDNGGGGSSRRRSSSSRSGGEVLGEQVSVLPASAPATGFGGLKMCIE